MRVGNPAQAVVSLLIAALCAGALLIIVLIFFGSDYSAANGRITLTVLALGFTSVTGVAGSNLAREKTIHAGFGYLTMAVALVALVIATVTIWSLISFGDPTKSAYALILAFATGHASYLLRPAREGDLRPLGWVRIATLLPLAALVVMAFIDLDAHREKIGPDPITAVLVLYLLGIALLPLVRRSAVS